MKKQSEREIQRQRHWQEVIDKQRKSGQSVRTYCRQTGIEESAFYWWRRKLTRRGQEDEKLCRPPRGNGRPTSERPIARKPTGMAAGFLPLRVVADRRPEDGCGVEILLNAGRTLRIRPGFDRQTLLDVLGVLEVRPC